YEHYSYFTPLSLQYILGRTGFRFTEIQSGFGEQYLFVDAFPRAEKNMTIFSRKGMAEDALFRLTEEFALCGRKRHEKVEELIATELHLGRKMVLWGAGSKGVTLLNQLADADSIEYVVDINPGKQGKYIPGSGQLVVSPEFLTTIQADTVFIMNDMYRQEIQSVLDSLNLSARIHSL
ncbi:MAG: SAM-dependent methyltransferase, partial [Proteobacteria bacterium]|nr:SAM-dependent methyltransferase [Pseudomonadota bacterium]